MNNGLFLDLYELTMAQAYFTRMPSARATFDLFIRSQKRPFYVACGIDDVLTYLANLRFSPDDIAYLDKLKLFERSFLDYLRSFQFRGEVWGIEEPEIVFAQEPILRISGNLIEAQIVESAVLNTINLATTLATKATRVMLAAGGKKVYDFSLRRTQGQAAALAAAKYSYLAGAQGTSNLLAGFLYNIPVAGTMAHSFVLSFEREIESFLAFAEQFPSRTILLVDTYNVREGVRNAIKAAAILKEQRIGILGIRLDSGNLAADACWARKALNEAGLSKVLIFASGDLDEYKIINFQKRKVPIDAYGVGTRMGCASDLPFTDTIYKLVEIQKPGQRFMPAMKLSRGKGSLPSRKEVFRIYRHGATMHKDYIGLVREKRQGVRLLKHLMGNGRIISHASSLKKKRELFRQKIQMLPVPLKDINTQYRYPVVISRKLSRLVETIKSRRKKASGVIGQVGRGRAG